MPVKADSKVITNKMPAPQLIDQLSAPSHLLAAWKLLNKSNLESFGESGESLADFAQNLDTNLNNLAEKLTNNQFVFRPTRPVIIAKDNGKFRPLQISEIGDRVVLKGVAMLLESYLSHRLEVSKGVSFAYQKRLGIQDALKKIKDYYDTGDAIVFEADIIDFFGTVQRQHLLSLILADLPDSTLNQIITDGITPKIGNLASIPNEQHYLFEDKGGIPQGNPLSPLFSNIYLAPFDEIMKSKSFHLVRYADDFVVMCKNVEMGQAAYDFASTYLLKELHLEVHSLSTEEGSKTRIVDPKHDTFSFLSVSFDGINLFPSIKKKNEFLGRLIQLGSDKNSTVLTNLTRLKNSHDGWISTYIFTDVQRYFEEIDHIINYAAYKILKISGFAIRKQLLGQLPKKYRVIGAKTFESGECLSNLQRKNSGIPFSKEIYNARIRKANNVANASKNKNGKSKDSKSEKSKNNILTAPKISLH